MCEQTMRGNAEKLRVVTTAIAASVIAALQFEIGLVNI
jgi:hypothetical protein